MGQALYLPVGPHRENQPMVKNFEILARSIAFNIAFFGLTAIMALCMLPTVFMPRTQAMRIVSLWVRTVYLLERIFLNLDFEVRGREHLPQSGSYLVAAKHESAYETMKLHILFDDPAIVLKQELLKIPVWGLFLKKIDPIAIDRSNREHALKSLIAGALHVRDQGRPIVIFPQGTRVAPDTPVDKKPYKAGIAKMAEAAALPIIPMALNTGMFWPRNSWLKRPGKVIFEFLPPIAPGQPTADIMNELQTSLESTSTALRAESR